MVINTDGSAVEHHRSAREFTASSSGRTTQEASGALAVTTSSVTVEVLVVIETFFWLKSQDRFLKGRSKIHGCCISTPMLFVQKHVGREKLEMNGNARL